MFGYISAGRFTVGRTTAAIGALFLLFNRSALAQTATACIPATGDAQALLAKGIESAGINRFQRPALGLAFIETVSQDFQSDRTYPPYLFEGRSGRVWYYPDRQLENISGTSVNPFGQRPMFTSWSTVKGSWMKRDSAVVPAAFINGFTTSSRRMNAWALLTEWAASEQVSVNGRCTVRDFPRMRLVRRGPSGEEKLYLDPGSGLPVQYEKTEDDFARLWGPRKVTYVYSNWIKTGDSQYPMASYRLVDGELHTTRTAALLERDTAPVPPTLVDTADMRRAAAAPPSGIPDTVRISEHTYLLHTLFYTNVATLVRDTVYLLDAQYDGEARARQDSTWIAKLFPGKHPVVLVVSDLAWPHISGVRSWVGMGAKVVAHRSATEFLTRVVNRRWTGSPDLLEKRRGRVKFTLIPVDDSLSLAGGAIRVYPINGIGSEGSVMTWLANDRFLFPGDYVQGLSGPSMAYASEVFAATRRVKIEPERFAAMHMPLTEWNKLVAALAPAGAVP